MIYSHKTPYFSGQRLITDPVKFCHQRRLFRYVGDHLCIDVIKNVSNYTSNIKNIPYDYLTNKAKDIVLSAILKHKNRNTRDNIAKIRENLFNIWKIGHYQKNEDVIESLLSVASCAIGLIPEEAITQENIIECVTRDISSLGYLSDEIAEREMVITQREAIIMRRRIKNRIFHEGDLIKPSDLIK